MAVVEGGVVERLELSYSTKIQVIVITFSLLVTQLSAFVGG